MPAEEGVMPATCAAVGAELKKHEKEDKAIHMAEAMAIEAIEGDEHEDAKKHYKEKYRGKYRRMMKKAKKEGKSMSSEPVNVFTDGFGGGRGGNWGGGDGGGMMGLMALALLGGRGGFGLGGGNVDGNAFGRAATPTDLFTSTNTILNGQGQVQLENGQQNILQAVNSDTRDNLLATCNLGDRLSTQVCQSESNIVNNITGEAGAIRAQLSILALQAANDKFDISNQLCQQNFTVAQQFSALSLQNCQDQNALQMQIANCCCDLQAAIAGVTAASVKDELDELRLEKALGAANASNGNTINQIAISLGAITQTLAALQAKVTP